MIYALTGANGFIASHMVTRLLSEGHEVIAVVRKGACFALAILSPTVTLHVLTRCSAIAAIDSAECECLRKLSIAYPGKLSITTVTDLYDTGTALALAVV